MNTTLLPVAMIRATADTQMREKFQEPVIKDYAEAMLAGDEFPPVSVVYDGEEHWLWDGFHRVRAARHANITEILAEVREGTRGDAILLAVGANRQHGVQRTNNDKRRAVEALLALKAEGLGSWSNYEMARLAGVHEYLVRKICKEQEEAQTEQQTPEEGSVGYAVQPHNQPSPSETPTNLPEPPTPQQTWAEVLGAEPQAPEPVKEEQFIPLGELAFAGVTPLLRRHREGYKPQFNRQDSEGIEWALWSWNPVTGCLHDCDYCYARDRANQYFPQGFVPTFHPDRLPAPRLMKPPDSAKIATPFDPRGVTGGIGEKNVFVCSMADLFGKWVPREWIDQVLAEVIAAPEWNFLFLTKFPQRLCEFEWPANAWVGTTVDRQYRVDIAEKAFRKVTAGVKWLSCEPMMEPLQFTSLSMFDWVVVGGASRSSQTPEFQPDREWVTRLHVQALEAGCKWYEKPNLKPDRIREYPGARE